MYSYKLIGDALSGSFPVTNFRCLKNFLVWMFPALDSTSSLRRVLSSHSVILLYSSFCTSGSFIGWVVYGSLILLLIFSIECFYRSGLIVIYLDLLQPKTPLFLHALSFECTTKLCINFHGQFLVYFHI